MDGPDFKNCAIVILFIIIGFLMLGIVIDSHEQINYFRTQLEELKHK